MNEPRSSRIAILSAIRHSLGERKQNPIAGWRSLPRNYRRAGLLTPDQRVQLLQERLIEYGAGVHHCGEDEIAPYIAKILRQHGKRHLATPVGLPATYLPPGFDFVEGDLLPISVLNELEGTVSAASLAIAETGTIVLQTLPGQGPRKLSLIPDFLLVIVRTRDVVQTVPEAFDRIRNTTTLPTTFISGPSATADIEMTRIQGVHGPRFLDVLFAD
jgi:L-lactate dehydrogenase complex protein LldG